MKFKVGDKVRFIGDTTKHGGPREDLQADIEKYNNRFTISRISIADYVEFKENRYWCIGFDEIELIQENKFTKSDLKDGDKCTLKNGQVIFVDKTSKYCFNNIGEQLRYFINDDVSIVKVERPVKYETLFERKEEILDETEKRYLASVIRPFRNKIKNIVKIKEIFMKGKEFLRIELKNDDCADFPYFEKGTMYKGMIEDKEYTLKELGL